MELPIESPFQGSSTLHPLDLASPRHPTPHSHTISTFSKSRSYFSDSFQRRHDIAMQKRAHKLQKVKKEREQKEMRECSFTPIITRAKPMTPAHPVEKRLMESVMHRERTIASKRDQIRAKEMRECTFHPTINLTPRYMKHTSGHMHKDDLKHNVRPHTSAGHYPSSNASVQSVKGTPSMSSDSLIPSGILDSTQLHDIKKESTVELTSPRGGEQQLVISVSSLQGDSARKQLGGDDTKDGEPLSARERAAQEEDLSVESLQKTPRCFEDNNSTVTCVDVTNEKSIVIPVLPLSRSPDRSSMSRTYMGGQASKPGQHRHSHSRSHSAGSFRGYTKAYQLHIDPKMREIEEKKSARIHASFTPDISVSQSVVPVHVDRSKPVGVRLLEREKATSMKRAQQLQRQEYLDALKKKRAMDERKGERMKFWRDFKERTENYHEKKKQHISILAKQQEEEKRMREAQKEREALGIMGTGVMRMDRTGGYSGYNRPSSAGAAKHRRSSSAGAASRRSIVDLSRTFHDDRENARKVKLEEEKKKFKFKPTINKRSRVLSKRMGDSHDTMVSATDQAEDGQVPISAQEEDRGHTPGVSARSRVSSTAQRPKSSGGKGRNGSRSGESVFDKLWKEDQSMRLHKDRLRRQFEEDEIKAISSPTMYAPKAYKHVQSRLQTNKDDFLLRVQDNEIRQLAKIRAEQEKKMKDEIRECTFHPVLCSSVPKMITMMKQEPKSKSVKKKRRRRHTQQHQQYANE
ncbi:hypothetical protein ADUPG1_006478 [Aduncisulcus paluster]|uniref:Uncharacterized protein n=1 Tax=Aduncisulcus paluster TaxID=2918883 RepID=A0ABQ5KLD0_9EUKA|nr:hypothetical protein ADUPG1_006478 [Aduncisulcus paluster]